VEDVPEHDSEQEREGHYCEQSGVDFHVPGHTVGVHNLLKNGSKFVELKGSGGGLIGGLIDFLELATSNVHVVY